MVTWVHLVCLLVVLLVILLMLALLLQLLGHGTNGKEKGQAGMDLACLALNGCQMRQMSRFALNDSWH